MERYDDRTTDLSAREFDRRIEALEDRMKAAETRAAQHHRWIVGNGEEGIFGALRKLRLLLWLVVGSNLLFTGTVLVLHGILTLRDLASRLSIGGLP